MPGRGNPADRASRGLSPEALVNYDLWWNGPDRLCADEPIWPAMPHLSDNVTMEHGEMKATSLITTCVIATTLLDTISSYDRLKHVTAWINRFIHNCLAKVNKQALTITDALTTTEIRSAETHWLAYTQGWTLKMNSPSFAAATS